MLRPATPLTILLFAAFVLLLLSVLSTPIIKSIPLARFDGVDFGVFGFCQGSKCSSIEIGYNTANLFDDAQAATFDLPTSRRTTLSAILIIHPIAALFTLTMAIMAGAAHVHSPSHSPRYLCGIFILSILTLVLALLAFLIEVLLFVPHMAWGSYLVLAAVILIAVSGVVSCAMRRTLVSRKARQKRTAENAEMNGENFYNRTAAGTTPKNEAPTTSPGTEKQSFATFVSKESASEERVPLTKSPTDTSPNSFGPNGSPPNMGGAPRRDQYGNVMSAPGQDGRDPFRKRSPPPPMDRGYNDGMNYRGRGEGYRGRGFSPNGMPPNGKGGFSPIGMPPNGMPPTGRGGYPPGRRGYGPPPRGAFMAPRGGAYMSPGRGGFSPMPPNRGGNAAGRGYMGPYARGGGGFGPRGPPRINDDMAIGAGGALGGMAAGSMMRDNSAPPSYRNPLPNAGSYGPSQPQYDAYGQLNPPMASTAFGANSQPPQGGYKSYNPPDDSLSSVRTAKTPPPLPVELDHEGPVGQAVEMDANTGSPSHPPQGFGSQYESMSTDGDISGMVGLQQQRHALEPHDSYTSQYSSEEPYVPPRRAWDGGRASPLNPGSRVSIAAKPAHIRTNSTDQYYEDVDPRFAKPDPAPPVTNSLMVPPLALHSNSPNKLSPSPLGGLDGNGSYDNLQSGSRSPGAESDTSNFTSVSQRGVNPRWAGDQGDVPMMPTRKPVGMPPRKDDLLLSENPDFSLPVGRGGRGDVRPPPRGMTPDGPYPGGPV